MGTSPSPPLYPAACLMSLLPYAARDILPHPLRMLTEKNGALADQYALASPRAKLDLVRVLTELEALRASSVDSSIAHLFEFGTVSVVWPHKTDAPSPAITVSAFSLRHLPKGHRPLRKPYRLHMASLPDDVGVQVSRRPSGGRGGGGGRGRGGGRGGG